MSFGGYLQANTAVDVLIGPFIDDTDGKTAKTALTLSQGDIKLSKNGQALAQKHDDTAAAADANGYYNCELDATDTNTEGTLTLIVHESGALPVRHDFLVISQAAYASIVTAKDAGYMDVNVKAISEDTTAPDNLELMYDGTGYAGGTTKLKVDVETIKTQAVTCAAGVTVLASVGTAATSTAQTGDSYAIVNGDHGLVSIQDDIDAILADTDELQTNQGNWLTATGFSTHSAADVVTAMETNGSKLDHLWEMTEDDGGTRRLTTNSLEQAPSGGLNATQIAEAVWDAVAASYDDASSMGALLNDAGAGASAATIADAVWDEAIADHTTATTFGGKNQKVVPSETINDYKATGFSTHSAADVWAVAARVLTANTNLSIPSAADIADAVWDEASTGHTDAGKAGAQLWTVLDAVPNTTEFEARTLAAADYTVVSDLGTVQTGDSFAIINGDHGLVSIQDDIDALYASIITNAAGADIAADIIAIKTVVDTIQADTDLLDDVSGGLADIHTDVADLKTQIGVAGAGLSAIPTVATVTNLTNAPTNGDFTAAMKSSITAAVPTAAAIGTDAAGKVLVTPAQKIVTDANGYVTYSNTAPPSAADVKTAIEAAGSSIASILADTGELQTDLVNGGRLDLIFDATKTAVDLCEDILRNKMEITDANGNVVLRADNNTDALFTVAAGVTDDLTTTIRKRLE